MYQPRSVGESRGRFFYNTGIRSPLIGTRQRRSDNALLAMILLCVAVLPLFLVRALDIYSETQRMLAWSVFAVSTVPVFIALSRPIKQVPLMPLLGLQYMLFFALPIFFEDSVRTLFGATVPEASAVDMTLLCTLLALISIGIGYATAGRVINLQFTMLRFTPSPNRLFWYAVVSLCGSAALQLGQGTLFGWSPDSLIRPLSLVLSADLSIAILACLYYQNALGPLRKGAAISLVCLAVGVGFLGGMFQTAVQPLLIWVVCRWVVKGKAPVVALALVTAAFFVFQPVKDSYRKLVQLGGPNYTANEKLALYGRLIKAQWLETGGGTELVMRTNRLSAQRRLSLLLATAHYVEMTPDPIKYKNGSTLGYMIYGWIPRVIWPNKPIAQEANKILPVEYDVQGKINQNTTMFGVGHVAEAYVNFGIAGIIPLFLCLGILYRVPQLLLERESTTATIAICVAVMVAMVPIGSSVSDAFGGFVQQIILQGGMLRLFTRQREVGRQAQTAKSGKSFSSISRSYHLTPR